jgi:methyl-accepting chemotaxis protein
MIKFTKNIKIMTLILIMFIVSLISLVFIGTMGYVNNQKINNNVEGLYSKNLTPIIYLGDIRKDILMTRINTVKGLFVAYEDSYATAVDNYKADIVLIQAKYEPLIDGSEEQSNYGSFKNTYNDYINKWNDIKTRLASGNKATDVEKADMTAMGEKLVVYLNNLVDINKTQALAVSINSKNIFLNSKIMLFSAISGASALLLIIGLGAILIIRKSMKEFIIKLDRVSTGDLTLNGEIEEKNEFGLMKKSLNKTVKNISQILMMIKEDSQTLNQNSEGLSAISEEMAASAQEIAMAIQEVAKGAYTQSDDLIEMKATTHNFGGVVEGIVSEINDVDEKAKKINSLADVSNGQLQYMVNSINDINKSFDNVNNKIVGLGDNINKIHEITNLINSIADQTNLLALNAAIEAARAGEAGKGFAVVADEIRKLAEQSKESSTNINSLLEGIFDETRTVVTTTKNVGEELTGQISIVEKSMNSFKDIIIAINDIIPKINNVSNSAENINTEKNNIIENIETSAEAAQGISASSEEIAASSEEMNASSEEVASTAQMLAVMTHKMVEEVNKFKL